MIKMVPLTKQKWENFTPYLLMNLSALEQIHIGFSIEGKENECMTVTGYPLNQIIGVHPNMDNDEVCRKEEFSSEIVWGYNSDKIQQEIEARIKKAFCTAIADFFVEELEEELMKSMIKHEFGFEQPEHIEMIYNYCFDMLFLDENLQYRDEDKISARKEQVFNSAYVYVQEEKEFHLDGFIQFRLKEYKYELEELIEFAIDEYIVDKEYQEFIQLLRLYIAQQTPKIPLLHAFHVQDRQFIFFNQQGEQLSDQQIEKYLQKWTVESVSYDDLIVSTLIAIAPKQTVIHTEDVNHTVIRTLMTIFQERIKLCIACDKCEQWQKVSKMT